MDDRKKRANKRQQELLVERLYENKEMARGNQADSDIIDLWASLTKELNILGCKRTVEQWQHVWHVWVAKIKTKAKKIEARGGRPAEGQGLTELEHKILSIIGIASIHSPANFKVEVPLSNPSSPSSASLFSDSPHQELQEPEQPELQRPEQPIFVRRRVVPRRRLVRPYCSPNNDLIQAVQESNRSLQDTIRHSAEEIAAALRDSSAVTLRAAQILAAALSSAQNSSRNMNQ